MFEGVVDCPDTVNNRIFQDLNPSWRKFEEFELRKTLKNVNFGTFLSHALL